MSMMIPEPLVSICIPTYNQAKFIMDALNSVLKQQYKNIEIIVVDDCSVDGTFEIVSKFSDTATNISVYRNKNNIGMVKNWNRCLELAKGKYVKFVFGDDLLCSNDAVSTMVQLMEASKSISLVSSARKIIDENSSNVTTVSAFEKNFVSDGKLVIVNCLHSITRTHNPIGEPTAVMFRKESASRGFSEKYNQLVDIEMWFHLLEQGDFAYISTPLCSFREHSGQQTKKNIQSLGFIDDLLSLFDDYLEKTYVAMGNCDRAYMRYYQLYKLLKHAKQGKYDLDTVNNKIDRVYGRKKFDRMLFFYRIYSPYWNIRRKLEAFFSRSNNCRSVDI